MANTPTTKKSEQANESNIPTPIFVLGLYRSGTTWLANVLAGHPNIIAVQSADHFGVHESIYFSHFTRAFGDITKEDNFRHFVDEFIKSDYYILSGVDPSWLRHNDSRDYAQIFRGLMTEMAKAKEGTRYWLEKSPDHTLLADRLQQFFPDARFICITRKAIPNASSRLWLEDRLPTNIIYRYIKLVRFSWSWCLYKRYLNRFCKNNSHAILLSYEKFARNTEEQARQLCRFLGLDFFPEMLTSKYRINTSFKTTTERLKKKPGLISRILITLATGLWRPVPLGLLRWAYFRKEHRHGVKWPDWCWRRRDAAKKSEPKD